MNNRIAAKIILYTGWAFLKNEFLKKTSLLLNKNLSRPPSLIDIKVTMRCNLRCQQCSLWLRPPDNELSTEAWKKIILDIKNYIGPYFIRFCGGEPFCRNDILELVNFCSRNELAIIITTNGTLIDKTVATELLKNNIAMIHISLDGFRPGTQDRLRGVIGSYEKTWKAIEFLKDKVPIRINTTIMQDNLDEILDLTEFAHRNKIQISFQGLIKYTHLEAFQRLFPKDLKKLDCVIEELGRKRHSRTIVNSLTQLARLKNYYYHNSFTESRKKYCEILYNRHLCIKYTGDVFICNFLGPIGNLRKSPLREIWHSKEANNKIQEMKKCTLSQCLVIRGCYKESYAEIITKVKRYLLNYL